MFATATYFNAGGVHIDIESESPPRSALGGSSVAAVALVAALLDALSNAVGHPKNYLNRRLIASLAYKLEETVAGVPCGSQDQLAAAYGGVHVWYWQDRPGQSHYKRTVTVKKEYHKELERRLLLAYCGKPHVSKDINGRWIQQFLAGKNRVVWKEIIDQTRQFAAALTDQNYSQAAIHMNREDSPSPGNDTGRVGQCRGAIGGKCPAKRLRCPLYGCRWRRMYLGAGGD